MRPLVLLIIFTTLLRIWAACAVGLGNGEAYYFSCALHPSLSYFDHPPLGILLGSLAMKLTGSCHPLVLRFPAILCFAATTVLLYRLTRKLFGPSAAFWTCFLFQISPVMTLSTATFFQMDSLLAFFFVAALQWSLPILEGSKPTPARMAFLGVLVGLGLLSKYSMIFFPIGFAIALIAVGRGREVFSLGYLLMMLTAGIFFLPVLIWNAQHEWISLVFQGGRVSQSAGIRLDWLGRNVAGQALWLAPWIWLPMIWIAFRELFYPRSRMTRSLAILGLLPITVFSALSSYAPIGFHFHWPMPGYLCLFPLLGMETSQKLEQQSVFTKRWLLVSAVVSAVGLAAFVSHASVGWWTSLGPALVSEVAGAPEDPTLECLEYKPLRDFLREQNLLGRNDCFVFTNRWFLSGKVEHALAGDMQVTCLHPLDPRGYAFWTDTEKLLGKTGILVGTSRFLENPHWEYDPYFRSIEPIGEVSIKRGGMLALTLQVYRCEPMNNRFFFPYGPNRAKTER